MSSGFAASPGTVILPDTAGPWPRFWARLLDQQLYLLPTAFLVGLLFPELVQLEAFSGRGGDMLLSVLLLPVAMVVDACFITLFGSSVGKALAGLRVADRRGHRLKPVQSVHRNLILY